MSYTIIKTGGKQFAVESGQKVRFPSIEAEAGKKVDIDTVFAGGTAAVGSIKATVVGHGLGDAGGDGADAALRHELDGNQCTWVDLL